MRAVLRLVMVIATFGMIVYGITIERHDVKSFVTGESEIVNGLEFTKDATVDRYILHDGELYDGHGLAPEPVKECPT